MIFAGLSASERKKKGMELLEKVGLDQRADHKPNELSGGQQQRVAIARSLANGPSIILADEPTGNLDLRTGRDIINILREMNQKENVTIISATHDLKMLDVSDRVIYIRDGLIEQIKERSELKLEIGKIEGEQE
jgi:putative ABC transport system ATP-binding protein